MLSPRATAIIVEARKGLLLGFILGGLMLAFAACSWWLMNRIGLWAIPLVLALCMSGFWALIEWRHPKGGR
jgi:hypothetical protein